MAGKLTSRQVAQLAWLETLPPKFDRMHRAIESIAALQNSDTETRALQRLLDELKAQAATLGVASLSDTFGYMGTLLRRGGGTQLKIRGLREMLAGVKTNYEGALRSASTPLEEPPASAP